MGDWNMANSWFNKDICSLFIPGIGYPINNELYSQLLQNKQRSFCTTYTDSFPSGLGQTYYQLGQLSKRKFSCGERIESAVEGIKRVINEEIDVSSF